LEELKGVEGGLISGIGYPVDVQFSKSALGIVCALAMPQQIKVNDK